MNRREALLGMGAMPLSVGAVMPDEAAERPPFTWESVGPGRWRFRSWTYRGDAWHPLVGHVEATAAGRALTGRVDPHDAPALRSRLDALGRDGPS